MERRQRVEVLFHKALALEPSARTSFLEEACSGEPELLEEVVSLISAHEHPWSFIDSPLNYATDRADDELSQTLIGTSIGRYQVVRLIKRSGMGEVYLARDTHLPREVALKLLPLMFTGDERRLRRFILEAEAASSLNHPNILTIHEIGHIRDVHYIATEFVDGQTLRERLADGRLELKDALEIAVGVTNALVASHAAGIVHRDIKPENIMIRRDGYIKVLDFGLAKLTERPDVRIEGNSPNISSMDTDPGTFMGTVGYLSPEQAKSLEVDTRSDVFSLGVVLYEMIAGQNPFNRDAFSDVINAILTTEPEPLASFVPNTPASLQKVVTRALAKDKQNRYQRTEDLLADLRAVQAQLHPRELTPRERWWRVSIGVAALIAIAVLSVAIFKVLNGGRSASGVSDAATRLRHSEIHSWKLDRGESGIIGRFSHDGHMVVFTMLNNGWEGIWIKQAIRGAEARLITRDATNNNFPIWSPDDQRVAFVSIRDGEMGIWASSINGGPAQLLGVVESNAARLKTWSRDGRTIYFDAGTNLLALEVATGQVTQLTNLERQAPSRNFSLSPNEDRIAYVGMENGQTDIWVASLHGKDPIRLTNDIETDSTPVWHPDGRRIVYLSNRGGASEVCIAFLDGSKPLQLTVSGEDHVISDISPDGARLLDVGSRGNSEIFSVDAFTGRESELTSGSGLKLWPEVSPDGQLIAFQSTNTVSKLVSDSPIFVKRSAPGGPMTQIATTGFGASWSADGTRLAFLRFKEGQFDLFSVSASGQDERRLTTGGVAMNGYYPLPAQKFGHNYCWSRNGNALVYISRASGTSDLWSVAADGAGARQLGANNDASRMIYEPLCGPDDKIVFAKRPSRDSTHRWSLWLKDGDQTRLIFETSARVRPLGWLATGDELLAASIGDQDEVGYPTSVSLLRVRLDGQSQSVGKLASAYFWSAQLAPDGRTIAFVSAQGNADNIWLTDIVGVPARKLTSNNEPKVFIPGVNWSLDGKTIYFGKHSSIGLIRTIDNFE